MIAVREATRVIDRAERRPDIAVWQNSGVPAGQSISHAHFHVAAHCPAGEPSGVSRRNVPEPELREPHGPAWRGGRSSQQEQAAERARERVGRRPPRTASPPGAEARTGPAAIQEEAATQEAKPVTPAAS